MNEQIKERLFTEEDLRAAIELYLEYTEVHGEEKEDAIISAVSEMIEGYDASVELYDVGELKFLPVGERVLRQVEGSCE